MATIPWCARKSSAVFTERSAWRSAKARLGQYYTVLWSLPESTGSDREIIFRYQQGESGSRVKTMTRQLPHGAPEGKEEFGITGDDYFDNGRVLAWKIDLIVDGAEVASEQSYLWK